MIPQVYNNPAVVTQVAAASTWLGRQLSDPSRTVDPSSLAKAEARAKMGAAKGDERRRRYGSQDRKFIDTTVVDAIPVTMSRCPRIIRQSIDRSAAPAIHAVAIDETTLPKRLGVKLGEKALYNGQTVIPPSVILRGYPEHDAAQRSSMSRDTLADGRARLTQARA